MTAMLTEQQAAELRAWDLARVEHWQERWATFCAEFDVMSARAWDDPEDPLALAWAREPVDVPAEASSLAGCTTIAELKERQVRHDERAYRLAEATLRAQLARMLTLPRSDCH